VTPLAANRAKDDAPDLSPVLARSVSVLGSTGSIGVSTLDVIQHARTVYGEDVMPVIALTAQGNVDRLVEQASEDRSDR
jgi:1-deoxy-D-xylulose-5-phosphate reductoisomerase